MNFDEEKVRNFLWELKNLKIFMLNLFHRVFSQFSWKILRLIFFEIDWFFLGFIEKNFLEEFFLFLFFVLEVFWDFFFFRIRFHVVSKILIFHRQPIIFLFFYYFIDLNQNNSSEFHEQNFPSAQNEKENIIFQKYF